MNETYEHDTPVQGPDRRTVLKFFAASGLVAAASSILPVKAAAAASGDVTIDWSQIARVSKTTATLQVVVNALIRRESPIHDNVFNEIRALHADYVRFVPWFPYPRLGVAELEPPTNDSTSWDFSLIDPLVEDFLQATQGHSTIMNFSTIPEWMWTGWEIRDGQLFVGGVDIGIAKDGLTWTDYTFAADVTPLATGDINGQPYAQAGLLFRMDAAGTGYAFLLSNYPYTSPAASGYVVFVTFNNRAAGGIQAKPLPFGVVGGQTYHVAITVSGDTFAIAVDGTSVDTVSVGSMAGTVGFREIGAESGRFDNVLVTASDGTVLMSDDFSDGLDQWVGTSAWSVAGGELDVAGGGNGIAKDGATWTDYTFAVDVTPLATAPYAQAGLLFRMDAAGNGYAFLLSNFAYTSPAASGYVVFVPFVNGANGAVRPTALPFAVVGGQTYHVEITVAGNTFTISVDGTTVDTVTASTVAAAGTVGFRESAAESGLFDNVRVTAPDGTVLLSDDFSNGLAQWANPNPLPDDPNAIDFGYSAGGGLAVPIQTVADYYRRLVAWYTQGGFTDELGIVHTSNHHFSFPYWEVLNELEHGLSPQLYTQLYDAIVTEIRKVSPQTKFVGLALGGLSTTYVSYFLDPANHAADVPIDLISYHFYAPASGTQPQNYGGPGFASADAFLSAVDQIEAIRMQLAPQVRTTVDETGTILDVAATQTNPAPIPDAYWNYSSAIYAYVFAHLALKGIDIVGESQMVGYPGQFPSVSMVDWNTGLPNARYRALQLMLEEMPPGSRLVPATGAPDAYYVLGFLNEDEDVRKVLVVNKTAEQVAVQMTGLSGAQARVVDQASGGGPIRTERVTSDQYTLDGYGVAVLTLRD